MPFGLRLWLLLLIAGCAEQALVVPESDWQTVPAAQRAAIDRQYEADLAAARAELTAATASLAALPRAQPAPPQAAPRPAAPRPASDDPWATAMRDHEQSRIDARGRVETAIAAVQRTDAVWRQLRVDTARARLDMLVAQREVTRAQAINRNLPGDDTYETAPVRGQFSRVQQRWYAVASRARTARDAFEHATTDLASAKEAYAQIMRNGPAHLRDPFDGDDRTARMELPGWVILQSDIRRRRGLRHFLEEAGTAQLLRKTTYQPSRAVRTSLPALAAAPGAPQAATPTAAAPPPVTAHSARPAAPGGPAPAFEHPADRAAAATPASAAAPGNRAAAATAPPTSAAGGKSAAPSPFDTPLPVAPAAKPAPPAAATASATPPARGGPTAVNHPADRAAAPSPPAAALNGKPAAPRGAAPAADHPANRAGSPAPTTAVSTTGRPEAARAAPSGSPKPARTPAPPSPATASARSSEHAAPPSTPARPAGGPHGAPPATGSSGVAKPVERPISEADAHSR